MYRIGVDLGGTNIAAAVVNQNYQIIKKLSIPTGANREANLIVYDIATVCCDVCKEADIAMSEIEAIGIASPGIVDSKKGAVVYSCNLPFVNFNICEELSKRLGIKNIHAENDANAAAWGEAVAGVARSADNSVMITLGTGVGGGVIIDGKVYSGFNFAGSELGHIVIKSGGRRCGCGRLGCWEAYSSATGLINMTNEKLDECEKSGRKTEMTELVKKYGKVNGRVAFEAARNGDSAAKETVDEYVEYLACGIANIINIFQPEVLSIGGGISGEGQYLLDMVTPIVNSERYGNKFIQSTDIRIAELENDAGIIGAAFLGI